jgi:hypothetical protein
MMWSCCQNVPEPDAPQSFPTWRFVNGTVVNAASKAAAFDFISDVSTRNYYATETEAGVWDVQFDEYVTVEHVEATSVMDAVRNARWYLQLDGTDKRLL